MYPPGGTGIAAPRYSVPVSGKRMFWLFAVGSMIHPHGRAVLLAATAEPPDIAATPSAAVVTSDASPRPRQIRIFTSASLPRGPLPEEPERLLAACITAC